MRSNRVVVVLSSLLAALLIVGGLSVFALSDNERQRQLDANARVQNAIELMYRFSEDDAGVPGDYFLDVLYLMHVNDISAETMDRMADMLGSKNWDIREFAARAFEWIGPRAKEGTAVLPALQRAIAEELAIWKGRRNLIIGAGPTTLDAEMSALAKITGVSLEDVQMHAEQFEKLPPDMQACLETFNQEECDRLMAEWRADPY